MSTISAGTTTTTALVQTGDTTGSLVLKTGSTPTTAMTINSSQIVNFANAPTVAGAALPSGAMTLISTQTASSSASLSWTGLSGYDKYMLIVEQLVPTTSASFFLTIGTGSSPTYLTSNYDSQSMDAYLSTIRAQYNYSASNWTINNLAVTANSGSTIGLSGQLILAGCSANGSGQILVANMGNYNVANTTYDVTTIFGYVPNTSPITAIKITSQSVSIFSGKASLYGISS